MVVSSTNYQPNSLRVFPERKHFRSSPCPASIRKFSVGVLAIAQIAGDTMFICPSSFFGGGVLREVAYFPPPYLYYESTKAVKTECSMSWRVVKVHFIGSLGVLAPWRHRDTMMWTTRS